MRARLYQTGKTLQLDGKPQEIIAVMRNLQQDAATKQKPVPDKMGLDDTGLRPALLDWEKVRGVCRDKRAESIFKVGQLVATPHKQLGWQGGCIIWRVCAVTASAVTLVVTQPVAFDFEFDEGELTTDNTGKCNTRGRDYGYNSWRESALRQWLNSSGAAGKWWGMQNSWDVAPGYAHNVPGFLAGFDAAFLECVKDHNTITALWDKPGMAEKTKDKFYLLSRTEVFGDANNDVAEGKKLDLPQQFLRGHYWWLRSPIPGDANVVYGVRTTGTLSSNLASNTLAVAPACVIG